MKEETFQRIYAQFFPRGADTSQYAHFVFNSFDPNRTGVITFTVSFQYLLTKKKVKDKKAIYFEAKS